MFIARTKTSEGIKTFGFQTLEAAQKAESYIKRTGCPGFVAECENESSMHGRIRSKWDGSGWRNTRLTYTIQDKRYADRMYGTLGTEEECLNKAAKINEDNQCWADPYAHVEHIVGCLWVTIETEPYTD